MRAIQSADLLHFLRRAILIIGIAAIPFVMFLVTSQLAREFEQSRSFSEEANRSYQIRARLQEILSIHRALEAKQRGYVVTGDPDFLDGFDEDRARIADELESLSALGKAKPQLTAALPRIRSYSRAKLDFMVRTIEMTRSGGRNRAAATVATERGLHLMEALAQHVAALDEAERRSLADRLALAETARQRTQRTAYALQTLLVLLLIAAGLLIARGMRARERAAEKYRDLSIRNEAIFNSARDAMLIHDGDGVITSLNPAAARLYGYSEEDMVGLDVRTLFDLPPTQEQLKIFLKRLQSRRQNEIGRVEEFEGRRRNGSTFTADVATSPVDLADGLCYLAVIRDVSDRKAVERMKSEFVSIVSHELRTPLTSIAGSLGLLSGGAAGALPDRAQRLISIAHSNSERLVRLINDILDIEKIESGKMSFDVKPVQLGRTLGQAAQANRAFAAARGVALEVEPVDVSAFVLADEDRFAQVLDNLISNAVKFSPEGEAVRLSVTRTGPFQRITVADRGPGIPEAFRSRIFARFAQADSSDTRQKGGTGLGLSIVKEIVTRLDGNISFESEEGNGTSFHVDLPAHEPGLEAALGSETKPRRRQGDLPAVLHVDDDIDMLRLVASAFEGEAEVLSTPSLVEAKAALERRSFDGVIVDIAMPEGSGLDLVPVIRQGVPVIAFTAMDLGPEAAPGIAAVLTKSKVGLDELVRTVLGFVAEARPKRGARKA